MLPMVTPADAGLSPDRLRVASGHVRAGEQSGAYSAAVLLVVRRGGIAWLEAFGALGHGADRAEPDTPFDLASLTKPIVACTLLTMVEDGLVSLAQPLAEALPAAAGSPVGAATIRQLATHVSGLPAWFAAYEPEPGRDAMLCRILGTALEAAPGERYAYSDLGYILLGEVIARAGGAPLQRCVQDRVLRPAGMLHTGYLPRATERKRSAATANCPMRPGQTLVGEVHDANAHAYGGAAGHAGVFGTAPDLARLAAALAGDGCVGGRRLLGVPTLRLVRESQVDAAIGGHSIGWFTAPNTMLPRGDLLGENTFGHTGFTGTMLVIEPALHLAVVLLTNRVLNPADASAMIAIRRRTLNAVASAVLQA